jgi:hypothetical protein
MMQSERVGESTLLIRIRSLLPAKCINSGKEAFHGNCGHFLFWPIGSKR